MNALNLLFVLALAVALAPTARAELSAFWRPNPITPAAIADDPTLSGMQSWSVMATNTNGFFGGAGLRAVLPPGNTYYRNALGGDLQPTAAQQAAHPALYFHTYVTKPNPFEGILAAGGGFPVAIGTLPNFGGPLDPIPGTFAVSWADFDPGTFPPGTYEMVRLTFPLGESPSIDPQSFVAYLSPDQTTLIPTTIPESAMTTLAVAGLFCLMSRWGVSRTKPETPHRR